MLARRMHRVTASAIMELIKTTAAGSYISFASGLPDPALFPAEILAGLTEQTLTQDGRAALQYGPAEGYPPLREAVAELLCRRGFRATPEHVLITNGSQQALDLAARLLLNPGDTVALENPSYLAAVQAFDSYEARYRTLPLDEAGMCLDTLPEVLAGRPRLLYTLPNFQNPTGLTLLPERRQRLAELAAGAEAPVIEDDAYHDLSYEGEAPQPVCSLADNPAAIYTGTFSKTVAPGLRVGYLCAAPPLVERLAQLKQITDLHTGSLTQRVVYRYITGGYLEPGIEILRQTYRARRDVMLAALEAELSDCAEWTRPRGGMFVWVRLPPGCRAGEILKRALALGVVFVPGASFHPESGGENTLRLNFVSSTEEKIRAGIPLLARAIREVLE